MTTAQIETDLRRKCAAYKITTVMKEFLECLCEQLYFMLSSSEVNFRRDMGVTFPDSFVTGVDLHTNSLL